MIKLSASGASGFAETAAVRDSHGVGLLPIQGAASAGTSFRVLGRVSPEAPWLEIKPAGSAGFLESISWVPCIRLEITGGTGTATLWIGEK